MHAGLDVAVDRKSDEILVDPSTPQQPIPVSMTLCVTTTEFENTDSQLEPSVVVNFENGTSHTLRPIRNVSLTYDMPEAQTYGLVSSITSRTFTPDNFEYCDLILVKCWPGSPNFEAASIELKVTKITNGDQLTAKVVGSHRFDFVMDSSVTDENRDEAEATSVSSVASTPSEPTPDSLSSTSDKILPVVAALLIISILLNVLFLFVGIMCMRKRSKKNLTGETGRAEQGQATIESGDLPRECDGQPVKNREPPHEPAEAAGDEEQSGDSTEPLEAGDNVHPTGEGVNGCSADVTITSADVTMSNGLANESIISESQVEIPLIREHTRQQDAA